MKKRIWSGTLLSLILFSAALASERTHTIVPEDYFSQIFLREVVASPDGQKSAFVDLRWDKEQDGRFSDIWVLDHKSRATQRLTFGPKNEVQPRWTPDGKQLYFIGHYKHGDSSGPPEDGSAQVWRIDADGKNLMAITRIPDGIGGFELSSDGSSLYFTVAREEMSDEFRDLRKRYKGDLEYGHGMYEVTELWKLDLTSWRSEMVADPGRTILEFAVSSDQRYIAMITTPDEHLISAEGWSVVQLLDQRTGTLSTLPDRHWRAEAPSPYGWLENITWSARGHKLAWSIDFDGYPMQLFASDFANGIDGAEIRELKRADGVSAMGNLRWLPDGSALAYRGDHMARTRVYSTNFTTNAASTLTPGDVVVDAFDLAGKSGDPITIQSELTYYHDLALWKKGKGERLTRLNPQVDSWKLPQISIFRWTGENGDPVEGILELPSDYDGSGNLPLLVNLHGGPSDAERYCFLFWIYGRATFAAKGYAMLAPNYRGSTGYGDKFMVDLVGNENDYDVKDILAGVDALIEQGIVDPERMAVSGWSNGGFLTNALIATDRFKAASSGAGVLDMTVQFLEEDTPGHVINFMQGLPWEQPEEYQAASPLYSLKPGLQTAVIIHVGEGDPRVPASHSRGLHRVLKYYLDMPVELVIYPGAGHNLTRYTHRLAKMEWDHAWFDKYLSGN